MTIPLRPSTPTRNTPWSTPSEHGAQRVMRNYISTNLSEHVA